MLVEELLGHPLVLTETTSIELQYVVDDIILRARRGNIKELGLQDLAGELNKTVGIYIDPNNGEFRQRLTDVLLKNDWVREVSPTGKVVIKEPGEFQPEQGTEPGEEVQKTRDEQERKAQKIASKNVKSAGEESL